MYKPLLEQFAESDRRRGRGTPPQSLRLAEIFSAFLREAHAAGITIEADAPAPAPPPPARPAPIARPPAPAPPPPPAPAWQVISERATALAASEHITVQRAVVKVCEADPALYAAYEAELHPGAHRARVYSQQIEAEILALAEQRAAAQGITRARATADLMATTAGQEMYASYARVRHGR